MMRRRAMYDTVTGQRTADGPAAPFDLQPAPEWMRDALCAQTVTVRVGDERCDVYVPSTGESARRARVRLYEVPGRAA